MKECRMCDISRVRSVNQYDVEKYMDICMKYMDVALFTF